MNEKRETGATMDELVQARDDAAARYEADKSYGARIALREAEAALKAASPTMGALERMRSAESGSLSGRVFGTHAKCGTARMKKVHAKLHALYTSTDVANK